MEQDNASAHVTVFSSSPWWWNWDPSKSLCNIQYKGKANKTKLSKTTFPPKEDNLPFQFYNFYSIFSIKNALFNEYFFSNIASLNINEVIYTVIVQLNSNLPPWTKLRGENSLLLKLFFISDNSSYPNNNHFKTCIFSYVSNKIFILFLYKIVMQINYIIIGKDQIIKETTILLSANSLVLTLEPQTASGNVYYVVFNLINYVSNYYNLTLISLWCFNLNKFWLDRVTRFIIKNPDAVIKTKIVPYIIKV
jgi:hypothetical protein